MGTVFHTPEEISLDAAMGKLVSMIMNTAKVGRADIETFPVINSTLRSKYEAIKSIHPTAQEVLALHGTRAEYATSIARIGLDPNKVMMMRKEISAVKVLCLSRRSLTCSFDCLSPPMYLLILYCRYAAITTTSSS